METDFQSFLFFLFVLWLTLQLANYIKQQLQGSRIPIGYYDRKTGSWYPGYMGSNGNCHILREEIYATKGGAKEAAAVLLRH